MIASFQIDHTKLNPGLYVSRIDRIGDEEITTFDIRVYKPNMDAMTSPIAHTIEHLMADFLRNISPLRNSILYFGPMGCLTGFYLLLKGRYTSESIKGHIVHAFHCCSKATSIPGASEKECGNFRLNDLKGATELCEEYSRFLCSRSADNLHYPD